MEFVWIAIAIAIYFVPSIVASNRDHHQTMAIIVLNVLLGWTFIGWVAALVWAATAVKAQPPKPERVFAMPETNPFAAGSPEARAWDRGIADRKGA